MRKESPLYRLPVEQEKKFERVFALTPTLSPGEGEEQRRGFSCMSEDIWPTPE